MSAILLVLFIPEHVRLWNVFPVWYHLTFLLTLAPLLVLGAWLTRTRSSGGPAVHGLRGQPPNLSS